MASENEIIAEIKSDIARIRSWYDSGFSNSTTTSTIIDGRFANVEINANKPILKIFPKVSGMEPFRSGYDNCHNKQPHIDFPVSLGVEKYIYTEQDINCMGRNAGSIAFGIANQPKFDLLLADTIKNWNQNGAFSGLL